MSKFQDAFHKSLQSYRLNCSVLSKLYVSGIIGAYSNIDHVAFRGINDLEEKHQQIIESEMYELAGSLEFPEKAVSAYWYKRTTPIVPERLFVSAVDVFSDSPDSQYVEWVLRNGNVVNHMAFEVDDIEQTVKRCLDEGIEMNTDGGIIKTSADGRLHQASTRGKAFVEFVQRDGQRDGFEVENAGPIFNSTKKWD